ncbi:MAG: hypothetical protein E7372_04925 [Clostridiales bacterium]|nr:hypothetical protein [Clostridiales bacterium]
MKRNKLKNLKKGIAIELAIYVMVIVVGLSSLLVSVTIFNKNSSVDMKNTVSERLLLDQIGQSYVVAVKEEKNLDEWKQNVDGYTADIISETQMVLKDSLGIVRLSVKLENYLGGYKIAEWKYS